MTWEDLYILNGQIPVPCPDVLEWAKWFEANHDARIVKQQDVRDVCRVSTVFLGVDHRFLADDPPLLFETMAFWPDGDRKCMRCATWTEAEEQHKRMVKAVEGEEIK